MGIKQQKLRNYAFIDGQNLYLGTTASQSSWKVDLYRLRKYLYSKYGVVKAYYFLGCANDNYRSLYDRINAAGFELVFREHSGNARSDKKGNVDTDVVFNIMRDFHERAEVDKFFLVSGDGDYYKTVKYLRDKGKLGRILFPSRKNASTLYRQIENWYSVFLDDADIQEKIRLK